MSTLKNDREALIQDALRQHAEFLAADGYSLTVAELDGDVVTVVVEAGPDACAECLVPKSLLASMFKAALPKGLGVESVNVVYPLDLEHDAASSADVEPSRG